MGERRWIPACVYAEFLVLSLLSSSIFFLNFVGATHVDSHIGAGIECNAKVFVKVDLRCQTIGNGKGRSAGHFSDPCGVAIDSQGHIIVADTENHRVQVLKQAE